MRFALSVFLFGTFFIQSLFAQDKHADPFAKIEHLKFPNGLQVYLAPSASATNTSVRLEVNVGYEDEEEGEYGVSHLLEHTLFRDKQLEDKMTYLQLIKERGGKANGSTAPKVTSYFGTIPHEDGTWLFKSITKMILSPSIRDEYVQKEKGTVELERGRPGPITLALGFNPMDYLMPRYLNRPDFWEEQFGIRKKSGYTLSEEQLSYRKLTTAQVKQHYKDYYYPANMKLFIAGNYDRAEIMDVIEKKWASLPKREGRAQAPLPKIKPALTPFRQTDFTTETPYIYLGTKAWDVSVVEREVLGSYVEYLSHRLMKEIRNLKGETYTASHYFDLREGYGYAYISFQTPKEHLHENIKLVKKRIKEEAELGALTDEQVKQAKHLYMSDYYRRGKEAEDMMQIAFNYDKIIKVYGKFQSPYKLLKEISTEEYNATLRKYFKPNQRYEHTYTTYYFFPYDIYILYFLVTIGTFFGLKLLLTKEFANDKVQWIRNIQFPPLHLLEAFTLVLGWYLFIHLEYVLNVVFDWYVLQSHVLIAHYFGGTAWTVCLLLCGQGVISLLPRKLMVMDQKLVIKSVTYYSEHVPLTDVQSVECMKLMSDEFMKLVFNKNVKLRFYYFNPLFWKPGLIFHLADGRALFFSLSNAEKARAEIDGIRLNTKRELKVAA